MPRRTRKSLLRHLVWIIPLLVLDFYLFRWLALRQGGCRPAPPPPATAAAVQAVPEAPPPPPPPVWQDLHTPTPQQNLLNPEEPGVLQPTASGRIQSARFGSTRTGKRGKHFVPVFHEGVDIAPTIRDRRGGAGDPVYSVAEGRVAFVNAVGGKSSYGKYVVVEHPDPTLGEIRLRDGSSQPAAVYTLYAHLADIRFGIRGGQRVAAGEEIGTMGHTASTGIPQSRSHLHWEIGLMLNSRFDRLAREEKLKPDFGNYHGHNLFGIDPLDFYAAHVRDPGLTMGGYLAALPPACEVVLRGRDPDYFRRYPALWRGAPYDGSPIRLTLAESGLPLSGRNANATELKVLGNRRHAVLRVDQDILGRNGRGYVAPSGRSWQFTERGKRWAHILFY